MGSGGIVSVKAGEIGGGIEVGEGVGLHWERRFSTAGRRASEAPGKDGAGRTWLGRWLENRRSQWARSGAWVR